MPHTRNDAPPSGDGSPAADPLIGRRLEGRYRIERHLADGGMGSVYVAHDERLDRDVALKVLRADLARDPAFVARFRREAQSAARLTNPHVVAVHDQGEDHGDIFLAMELVRGQTLRDVLRHPHTTYGERLEIFDQMLTGLAAAHAEGIVHRDIKPENVLIDSSGHVKVADFGLARAIASSTADSDVLLGTASYLSPEQVEHGRADTRSDVYACGLVLYEVLTGRRAFDGEVPINVAYRHVHEDVPPVGGNVPGGHAADQLIARACAKNPGARPANAAELRADFRLLRATMDARSLETVAPVALSSTQHSGLPTQSHTAHLPHGATSVLETPAVAAPPKRKPIVWALAVVGALAALVLGWLFLLGPFGPRSVPDVHGQSQGAAVQRLRSAGFDVDVTTQHNDSAPSGTAIGTSPGAGSHRWPFGAITLDMSDGPAMVTVPDVSGRSESDARQALAAAGLPVRQKVDVFSATAAGTVVNTDPATGTRVRHDSPVTLSVSKGPQPIVLPDLKGKQADSATSRLEQAGLQVTTVSTSDDTVPSGKVISTDPSPGTTVHTGDTITVRVSTGKEQVALPDVTGMSASDAKSTLEDAGFSVDGVGWLDELLDRTVATQSPDGGNDAHAPKGSTVKLGF